MAGAKWTVDETIALIDAYSEKMVQETMEGIASNRATRAAAADNERSE